jgi:hypothetical protein
MALMYPWATKEYLLWNMSLSQIILYHNIGIEIQYPQVKEQGESALSSMSAAERREAREHARRMMQQEEPVSDAQKEQYRSQYGAIDDAG